MSDFVLKKLDKASFEEAQAFVIAHEAFCVTLSSEFEGKSKLKDVYAVFENRTIYGIVALTRYGFLLHCLPDVKQLEQDSEFCKCLEKALGAEKIGTIMGEESGTRLLQRLYPANPDCVWDYNLLEYGGKKLEFCLPACLALKKCETGDEEILYPLQKQ